MHDFGRVSDGVYKTSMKTFKIQKEIIGIGLFGAVFLTLNELFGHPMRSTAYILPILAWGLVLLTTYKIEIDSGVVKFYKIFRTIIIPYEDITSVVDRLRFHQVNYKGGSIYISPFFDDLSGLIKSLEQVGATIEDYPEII